MLQQLRRGPSLRQRWEAGGREGRRGGKSRPAAHLIQLRLGRNPQLRVYGALQRLDDPVEVHGPGRGLRPRASRPGCSRVISWPFRARTPQGNTLPQPPGADTAACSYLLRHSDSAPPVLPPSPPLPQLSLHSPFTTAGGRWENRKWRLLYDRLFPWGVLRRPALLGDAMMLYGKCSTLVSDRERVAVLLQDADMAL